MLATMMLMLALATGAPDAYQDTFRQAQAAQAAGRHAQAVSLFEKAVGLESESEAALAGLMTSLIALERWERAAEVGKLAQAVDPGSDAFKTQTANAQRRRAEGEVQVSASVSFFGVGYLGSALLSRQFGFNVTTSARMPGGFGLWLGATFLQAEYADGSGSYQQATPTFGLTYAAGSFFGGLSGTFVASSDDSIQDTGVLSLKLGGGTDVWALSVDTSLSLASERTSLQLNPRLRVKVAEGVVLEAGPEVQVHTGSEGDEALGLVHASATLSLSDSVALQLGAYGGARRYAVESGGMTVYTGSERYRAGGHLSLTWQASRWLALGARLGADYGDEVSGESQEFTALGAGLFVNLKF